MSTESLLQGIRDQVNGLGSNVLDNLSATQQVVNNNKTLRTDLASPDVSKGLSLVTYKAPVNNALAQSASIILDGTPITPQTFDKDAGTGGDDTYALDCFFAAMKEQKRKSGTIPRRGFGGYRTRHAQVIDFSNFCLMLEDNLLLTSTTKSSCLLLTGTATTTEIENVSIVAPYPVTIDGNGWNITDYTYSTADSFYCALLAKWVRNLNIKNIHTRNGLVGGILAFQCRGGVVEDAHCSYTRYDNGFSANFDPGDYSEADMSTWCNILVRRLRVHHNGGFGATQYGASGVHFDHPKAWLNGNNVTTAGNPGPGGGFSSERNGEFDKDHHCTFENPIAINNFGRSFFVSASGTQAYGKTGVFKSAKIPTNYTDTVGLYGNNVTIFGAEKVSIAVPVKDAERHNYFGLSTTGRYIDLEISGSVSGAAQRGAHFQGIKRLVIDASFESNGLSVGALYPDGVYIDNAGAAYNVGSGLVDVTGLFSSNGGSAIRVQNVLDFYCRGIRGKDNNANHSAQSAIFADYCGYVSAKDVDLRGTANTSVVTIGGNTAKGLTKDVAGDATTSVVSNSAAIRITSTGNITRSSLTDSNYTTPSSAKLIVSYASALTANRTVTPNATNPTEGDEIIAYRDVGSTDNFLLTVGPAGTQRSLAPGQGVHFYRTGSAWIVIGGLAAQPYDVAAFYPGKPAAGGTVSYVIVATPAAFFAALAGSKAKAKTAATASSVFDIKKNGVSVGSLTFAAGAVTGTFTVAAGFSLVADDTLEVTAPVSQDATLADVAITLHGLRSIS